MCKGEFQTSHVGTSGNARRQQSSRADDSAPKSPSPLFLYSGIDGPCSGRDAGSHHTHVPGLAATMTRETWASHSELRLAGSDLKQTVSPQCLIWSCCWGSRMFCVVAWSGDHFLVIPRLLHGGCLTVLSRDSLLLATRMVEDCGGWASQVVKSQSMLSQTDQTDWEYGASPKELLPG